MATKTHVRRLRYVVMRTSFGGLDITRYTLVYRLLHDQHQTGMFSTLYSLHNVILCVIFLHMSYIEDMFLSFCVFVYTLMHLHTHKYGRTLGMSFSVRCGKMQRAIAVLPIDEQR